MSEYRKVTSNGAKGGKAGRVALPLEFMEYIGVVPGDSVRLTMLINTDNDGTYDCIEIRRA